MSEKLKDPQVLGKIAKKRKPGQFQKGQSANPGGLPRRVGAVRDYAREFTFEAVDRIIELMRQTEDDKVAFAAAREILDRSIGKPRQFHDVEIATKQMDRAEVIRRAEEILRKRSLGAGS